MLHSGLPAWPDLQRGTEQKYTALGQKTDRHFLDQHSYANTEILL